MKYTYEGSIDLPVELSISSVQMIEEYLTGIGSISPRLSVVHPIKFSFETEDNADLWDVCELAKEVEVVLQSHGIEWTADKKGVKINSKGGQDE